MAGPGPGRGAVALAVALVVAAGTVLLAPGPVVARRGGVPLTTAGPAPGGVGAAAATGPGPARDAAPGRPDLPATAGTDGGGPTGGADAASRPPDGIRVTEVRGGWRLEDGLETAAAVGLLAGAAWATANAPNGAAPHVVLEAVEAPGPGAAVVTLLVAPGVADPDPRDPTTLRLAVPVVTGPDGIRPAGTPWVLPGPDLRPLPPPGRPVDDPELVAAARLALDRVGLDGASLASLEATDAWPFLTRLADGRDGPWLRWHLDRFVVTGIPLRTAAGWEQGTDGP